MDADRTGAAGGDRPLRAAIIGTGDIAGEHAEAIAASAGRVVLTAVADVDPARAAAFAAAHGGARAHVSAARLLAEEEVDLVHLCTPSVTHVALAEEAMRAGTTVLTEKPPAVSLRGVDHLARVEAETGRRVYTVLQHRFSARLAWLAGAIASGALGAPRVATCETLWFRPDSYYEGSWHGRWDVEGGGPTLTLGIHQYDLLVHLLGPWRGVVARMAGFRAVNEAEDVASAVVEFASGALAAVTTSAVSPRQTSRLRLDLEHATVELEHLYGYDDSSWTLTPAPGHEGLRDAWAAVPPGPPTSHAQHLAAVLDALDRGEPAGVALDDVRRTLSLTTAMYASAAEGRRVVPDDLAPGAPYWRDLRGRGGDDDAR